MAIPCSSCAVPLHSRLKHGQYFTGKNTQREKRYLTSACFLRSKDAAGSEAADGEGGCVLKCDRGKENMHNYKGYILRIINKVNANRIFSLER